MNVNAVAEVLTCITSAVIMLIMLDALFERREISVKWIFSLGTASLALMMWLSNHTYGAGALNMLFMLVSVFIASFWYRTRLYKRIFAAALGFAILTIAEMIVLYMVCAVFNVSVTKAVDDQNLRLLGTVISKMLTFVIVKLISVRLKKKIIYMNVSYWIMFAVIFSVFALSVYFIYTAAYKAGGIQTGGLTLICSYGLVFSALFSLYLFENMAEQNEIINRHKLTVQQLELQKKHFDELMLNQKQLKQLRHDLSNHLISLAGYFKDNDSAGGLEYIKNISGVLKSQNNYAETGNIALDAVINAKKEVAAEKGIDVKALLQVPENMPFSPADICIILGNALDNAIEACEKLSDIHTTIDVKLVYDGGKLICKITNPIGQKPKPGFATAKQDKQGHGIGLQSIKTAAEKYMGSVEAEVTESEFTLSIMLFAG